jgi:hypothetical protein
MDSPERQKANIEALCLSREWVPEFYTDTEGHKSAFYEENRPSWLSLKERIGAPDVIAIVANDPNRIHRRFWRTGQLLDLVERHGLHLIFASPTSAIRDIKDPRDKFILQMYALMDENYVLDISRKQRDSILHRKSQGKTIGLPPFGSLRNEEGFLMPSPYGAWVFPDERAMTGLPEDEIEGAEWRGYYECAYRILTIYVSTNKGRQRVAYQMNDEGWRFRDRQGNPRPLDEDDVRRVTSNWAEYGGIVSELRAKDRPAYDIDMNSVKLNPERAIFPLDLLHQVAETLHSRSFEQPDDGVRRKTQPYALAHMVYCYHCDEMAKRLENPKLRTRLGSVGAPREPHYRHREGRKCGCEARSVLAAAVEGEVGRLLKLLAVNPNAVQQLADLAAQMQGKNEQLNLEKEKEFAINRCRTILERAKKLYLQAELSDEEYQRICDENEREILRWENRTQDISRMYLQMEKCAIMVESFNHTWDGGTNAERFDLIQSLFDEIVVNVDTRRITSFKLNRGQISSWCYVPLFMRWKNKRTSPQNSAGSTFKGSNTAMPPRTAKTNHLFPQLVRLRRVA